MNQRLQTLRAQLAQKLPLLTLLLFLIQPAMDVLSFWLAQWGVSNTPTLLLRLLVLGAMTLAGLLLTRRRRVYYAAGAVMAVIGACHVFACLQFGYASPFTDLANYIRVLQLPLTVLCLITFLRENEACYTSMLRGITANLFVILAVQVLAIVTGTEPHTYDDGSGYIGWFSNTNTQSAILATVIPVAAVRLLQHKGLRSPWFWCLLILGGISMFSLGTRLGYGGALIICFGLAVSLLIISLRNWQSALSLVLVGVLLLLLTPISPMMGHRKLHSQDMSQKQDWILNDLENPKEPEEEGDDTPPLAGEPLELTAEQREKIELLTPIYQHYMSDFVAIFGVERTIHMYDYTSDILTMSNTRDKKLMFADAIMDLSPLSAKLFGIELSRFTVKGHIYDVENDFHGMYYLYGILGLAAMLVFLGVFLFWIIQALCRNFRRYFTLQAAAWGIALVLNLAHAYFTAGVLRRPSASFYLAAVLAGVYYLVKIRQYPDKPEV